MNRNFGKNDKQGKWQFAPDRVTVNGVTYWGPQDAALYAQAEDGPWLPYRDEKPTVKLGVYYVPTEARELRDGVYYRVYDERPIVAPPPPVTRYSKLKLIVAAKQAGKWAAFKAFIAQAGYEDEWAACQFLSSDYAQFAAAKEAIIAAGIATAEEVEAILAASVDEEVR